MSDKKRKRLKIGIFLDSYYPEIDGVVMVTDKVATALAEFNDVTLIIPDMKAGKDEPRPYDIIRTKSMHVPLSNYRSAVLFKSSGAYKQILKKKFDVIQIHSPFTLGMAGAKLAKKLNIPALGTVHSQYPAEIKKTAKLNLFTNIVMKYVIGVYNTCAKTVLVDKALYRDIRSYGYKYKPVVIPNATDLTPPERESVRKVDELYGLKDEETVLLFVGRISSTKNVYFTLEVLKLLKEENEKFRMLFVGFGPDEEKLQSKIREYGMESSVQMTGKISDRELLSAIYARADLLVFPSIADTCGCLVKIEAAVNETPGLYIENTRVAGNIRNNVNGFLAPDDVVKYKDRLKEIIHDRELLRKVAVGARETLAVDWRTIAEKYHDEYMKSIEIIRKKKKSFC